MIPRYLTGASTEGARTVAQARGLGLLVTPDTAGPGSRARYHDHIRHYPAWAADNGCYAKPERYDGGPGPLLTWLDSFPVAERRRCLFATAPDVLRRTADGTVIGDAAATLEHGLPVLPKIRSLGYPAALVAQDGVEHMALPWDAFDVLFIGGSTEWKLSAAVARLSLLAVVRGKHVHMGRVNSLRRVRIAQDAGCHTVDGTYLAFGPNTNLPKLLGWYDVLEAEEAARLSRYTI